MNAEAVLKRHDSLKSQRLSTVESIWRECYDLTFPVRGDGFNGFMAGASAASAKQSMLLDSTAADSINVLASNMMSGLTPSNTSWFEFDAGDETDEERRWLEEAAVLTWQNIHMANFDAEAFECCLDIAIAGQFALFIEEDTDRGGLSFHQWALATCYVGSTRPDGRLDIVHREYQLTAEQAITEFGSNEVGEVIRKAHEQAPDTLFAFIHAIYPRKNAKPGTALAKNLPIESCHVAVDQKILVKESGYHEMPVVLPRWTRIPSSLYGLGPMYAALPTVRTLNTLKALELSAADIAVAGMWIAEDDGVLNARTVKLGPRKIVIAASTDSMKSLETGSNFALSEALTAQMQSAIRKTLMADQLPPADGPMKTAYEYSVRVEMIRKLLGPIYGRLQAEYLKPLVERCFGLAFRAGIFKPIPESLRDREYSVRYVSPLARAQRLDDVNAMDRYEVSLLQAAQAGMTTVMDNYDMDQATRERAQLLGVPAKLMRDTDEVAKKREEKAAAEAEAQQAAIMQQGAMAAADAGGKKVGASV